jgi:hypothetical protein
MSSPLRSYFPPPTVEALLLCDWRLQFIFGPLGSGKTTGVLIKLLTIAHAQIPNANGVRKTRFAVVRNTRQQLKDSVLKTVLEWLPPNGKTIRWYETDATLVLDVQLEDGTSLKSEFMFRALDDEKDARRLLSTEYTAAWISEFREIPFGLLTDILSRTGRYPSVPDGGASWYGVIGESNMCTRGSEWFKFLMLERPAHCAVFIQPSAVGAHAENLINLKPDYYTNLLYGKSDNWIQAHIKSEFPDSLDGKAVWGGSYSFERHVGKEILMPSGTNPVIIGCDQGRSPAAVAMQMDLKGKLRILRTTHALGIGMDRFASEYLRPMVTNNFPSQPILVVIDPAGCAKSQVNDQSPKDVLEAAGFKVMPAPTNDVERRIAAVDRRFILHEGIEISPDCRMLIHSIASEYKYKTKKDGELEDRPEKKHPYSDLADALQYGTLVAAGDVSGRVLKFINRGKTPPPPPPPTRGWT